MIRLCVTGGIGTGKSAVLNILADLGVHVADADRYVKTLIGPHSSMVDELVEVFGPRIRGPHGGIDRPRLAAMAFTNETKRLTLEQILHPKVMELWQAESTQWEKQNEKCAAFEVPLLYETGMEDLFDKIFLVTAPMPLRLRRISERGMDEGEAKKRMATQWTEAQKKEKNPILIDNGQSLAHTKTLVTAIYKEILREFNF